MRPILVFPVLVLVFFVLLSTQSSCAGSDKHPLEPGTAVLTAAQLPSGAGRSPEIRSWGAWTIHCVDASDGRPARVEAVPLRDGQVHLDVTDLLRPPICSNCLHVAVVSVIDKDWTIRATLTNPTVYTAYDVAGIFPGIAAGDAAGEAGRAQKNAHQTARNAASNGKPPSAASWR